MRVCSTTHLYHYFFEQQPGKLESVLEGGIRPLSDFPESERWHQTEEEMPGFYERLYDLVARPVLDKPYPNSGVFTTPIDFRLLEGSFLAGKSRFAIPFDRFDPDSTVVTYVIDEERVSLAFSPDSLEAVAELWDDEMVTTWFGVDPTKAFFYVPQVAAYQGQIPVDEDDYQPSDST